MFLDTQLQPLGFFEYHQTIQSLTSRKRLPYAQKRLDAALYTTLTASPTREQSERLYWLIDL